MTTETATARTDRARTLLREVFLPGQCLDRYDASYLDDLPDILREIHGIGSSPETADGKGRRAVAELIELAELPPGAPLEELAPALRRIGVSDDEFRAPRAPESVKTKLLKYQKIRTWKKNKDVVVDGTEDSLERINTLQKQLSLQSGGDHKKVKFEDLSRPGLGDPWTSLFRDLVSRGVLRADEPVLTIGPRWAGEIVYFRNKIGLTGTIGLDLFSYDDSLVKVGDMHEMPFDNSTFGMVYQRNTFNKAYDIRKTLRECVRVLRPGGVLVTDDCLAYTDGVSEMARTSMPSNQWMLRFLGDLAGEVLFDRESPSSDVWFRTIGQLAIRIDKR